MSVSADGPLTLYVAPFPRCNPTSRSRPSRTAGTGASRATTPSEGDRKWMEEENVVCCVSKLTHQGAKPCNNLEV